METEIIILFVAGAFGALAKDIIQDGEIVLPKKINGKFSCGFLGGMVAGGMVGYLVDNNPTTAFLAGYAGTAVIENLLLKKKVKTSVITEPVREIIKRIAINKKVDPNLALRVAKCESGLDPRAVNVNALGSTDRGLFQINDKYHPEVTKEEAFDPEFATNFFCDAVNNNNLSWWDASKKCWNV